LTFVIHPRSVVEEAVGEFYSLAKTCNTICHKNASTADGTLNIAGLNMFERVYQWQRQLKQEHKITMDIKRVWLVELSK
jgi:hypothetical protein